MALLQYRCPTCGKKFEELVKKYDETVLCPDCNVPAERDYTGCMYSATGKQRTQCSGNCKTCSGCH